MSSLKSLIEVDWDAFDPWRIQPVRHQLSEHPLLQLDQLIELGRRFDRCGQVRTHSAEATAATPFNDAPRLHPNAASAVATLSGINDARAWMSLLNVQADPLYRRLIDEALDGIQPGIERVDPGMCYRGGWIFISSPRAVTPFHMDKEHNFILQMQGRKRVYVWDHRDTSAVSERARDRFHRVHARDLIQWREELKASARVFDLEPGQGAYMSSTSPHMVENGDAPSITMSFTYYTDATRRDAWLHGMHDSVRRLGIEPPTVDSQSPLDGIAYAGYRAARSTWRAAQRAIGRDRPASVPYAAPHLLVQAPD